MSKRQRASRNVSMPGEMFGDIPPAFTLLVQISPRLTSPFNLLGSIN